MEDVSDERHILSMIYWALIVEHHQAILHLVESNCRASAFALLRPFEEAFLRSFVAMYGTDSQVAALWDDKYNTDFEVVGKQIDKKLGLDSKYGFFFPDHIKSMHGLTYGGMEQQVKFTSVEPNQILAIGSQFSDDQVLNMVMIAMVVLFEAALFKADFWGYTSEHQSIRMMHVEYCKEAANVLGIDVNTLETQSTEWHGKWEWSVGARVSVSRTTNWHPVKMPLTRQSRAKSGMSRRLQGRKWQRVKRRGGRR